MMPPASTGSHRNQRSDSASSVRAVAAGPADSNPPRLLAGARSSPPHSRSPRSGMVDAQKLAEGSPRPYPASAPMLHHARGLPDRKTLSLPKSEKHIPSP